MEKQFYSVHPYEPFIPEGATKLIIGTMPPYRYCIPEDKGGKLLKKGNKYDDVDFYYGSCKNSFWDIMTEVADEELYFGGNKETIEMYKKFLSDRKIAVTDMIKTCCRKADENGKPSDLDNKLYDLDLKDLKLLLKEKNSIDTLIYTNRGKIRELVENQTGEKHVDVSDTETTITINDKEYKVIQLISPSEMALFHVSKEERLKQYQEVFSK